MSKAERISAPARILTLTSSGQDEAVSRAARAAGAEVVQLSSVTDLFNHIREESWSATLLSLSVDSVDEAVASRIQSDSNSGTLLLSASELSFEQALLKERVGAESLLREPLDEAELTTEFASATPEAPIIPLSPVEGGGEKDSAPLLIGNSEEMATVFGVMARVAASTATVLLTGESGTGKEIVAQAIHHASDRRERPFVAVNCAAIPEHLLESELFGHERGAFTGAVARRVGRFERAEGGTLFLDEIGDMSLVLQAKLLRVLEERTVERVGGDDVVAIDVRVIAATNQELPSEIAEGNFREDLYFRLAVVELHLPPLRRRRSDIRSLAKHFAASFALRHGRPLEGITEDALTELEQADWPGNVRQLRNVLDRGVLLARGRTLRVRDLGLGAGASADTTAVASMPAPTQSLEEVEIAHISRVLAHAGGHMGKAAGILGIHRNTLSRKVQEYALTPSGSPTTTPPESRTGE